METVVSHSAVKAVRLLTVCFIVRNLVSFETLKRKDGDAKNLAVLHCPSTHYLTQAN